MNNAKRLIYDFVNENLQGDLSKLPHFDFAQLQGDRKYGACNGDSFDCDNTNLSKAIYLLVFEGVWNDMTSQSLDNGMYRGDTINTFNTTFGKPIAKGEFAGINRFEPDHKLQQRVMQFHSQYHTIGNFMVLPNTRVGKHSLNTFRGTFPQWRDYIDKFVGALHQQLTEPQRGNSELFQQLVAANIKDFEPYCHQEGFELLMNKLLLNDCINQEGKPKQLFDTVYHWDKRLTRDLYFRHINQYLDFCESFIEKRGVKMVKILASKIG
jgi:hypothetical protein